MPLNAKQAAKITVKNSWVYKVHDFRGLDIIINEMARRGRSRVSVILWTQLLGRRDAVSVYLNNRGFSHSSYPVTLEGIETIFFDIGWEEQCHTFTIDGRTIA